MGKCFEIANGGVSEGITLTKAGQIQVGDEGRGRSCTLVNIPKGAVVEKNRLMSVPGSATVVAIRDHSGYRGSWRLAEYATHRCSRDGQQVGADEGHTCPECGDYLYGVWDEHPTHAAAPGHTVEASALGKVIAQGRRAQGDAGRMGGGAEYLLALKPGTRFSIRRSGRLYGSPAVLNVEVGEDSIDIFNAWAAIRAAEAEQAWEV